MGTPTARLGRQGAKIPRAPKSSLGAYSKPTRSLDPSNGEGDSQSFIGLEFSNPEGLIGRWHEGLLRWKTPNPTDTGTRSHLQDSNPTYRVRPPRAEDAEFQNTGDENNDGEPQIRESGISRLPDQINWHPRGPQIDKNGATQRKTTRLVYENV